MRCVCIYCRSFLCCYENQNNFDWPRSLSWQNIVKAKEFASSRTSHLFQKCLFGIFVRCVLQINKIMFFAINVRYFCCLVKNAHITSYGHFFELKQTLIAGISNEHKLMCRTEPWTVWTCTCTWYPGHMRTLSEN